MSDEAFDEREKVEGELETAHRTLAELRATTPREATCGNPTHAGAVDRIETLEALVRKMARGKRTTTELAVGRSGRLQVEIERLQAAIAELEPTTRNANRALLAQVKAAQQRRRILELKMAPVPQALVKRAPIADLATLDRDNKLDRATAQLAFTLAIGAMIFTLGPTAGLTLLITLVAALFTTEVAFPTAQREVISPSMIYGERWKHVSRIALRSFGGSDEMVVYGKKTHRLDDTMPGFYEAVRIARAAADAHSIPVEGGLPERLALPNAASPSNERA